MLILLSPAKKLTCHEAPDSVESTMPQLLDNAEYLMNKLKKYSPSDISKLMKVSDGIAQLNYSRNQVWDRSFSDGNACMAAYTFDGAAYQGLDAKSLTKEEMDYAQSCLRILSGLYGVLRPKDLMLPYRLEMGTRMKVTAAKSNLYQYWDETIMRLIESEMNVSDSEVLLNLASNEYFKAVKPKQFSKRIITPQFKDFKAGEYKTLMVYVKKARGLMTRFVIKNEIKDPELIKAFDYEGYAYNERLSEGDNWMFTRDKPFKIK